MLLTCVKDRIPEQRAPLDLPLTSSICSIAIQFDFWVTNSISYQYYYCYCYYYCCFRSYDSFACDSLSACAISQLWTFQRFKPFSPSIVGQLNRSVRALALECRLAWPGTRIHIQFALLKESIPLFQSRKRYGFWFPWYTCHGSQWIGWWTQICCNTLGTELELQIGSNYYCVVVVLARITSGVKSCFVVGGVWRPVAPSRGMPDTGGRVEDCRWSCTRAFPACRNRCLALTLCILMVKLLVVWEQTTVVELADDPYEIRNNYCYCYCCFEQADSIFGWNLVEGKISLQFGIRSRVLTKLCHLKISWLHLLQQHFSFWQNMSFGTEPV